MTTDKALPGSIEASSAVSLQAANADATTFKPDESGKCCNRNRVSLDPLTFVIVVLASMMLGLILLYVAPLVNGTRPMDCMALWEAREAERQEGARQTESEAMDQ